MSWEEKFGIWAKGPAATEQTKCENAEAAVRKALNAHEKLAEMDISIFAQGSYRNRTNVRQDSDVDICVRLNSTFFPQYPPGKTQEDFGNIRGDITFSNYKSLIQSALERYFEVGSVTRGDKAFKVHANTYRIDADVVATFEHRRYYMNSNGTYYHLSGIGFDTDKGVRILNWPNQHYENGVKKHEDTGRRFKKIVRILKRLRNEMQEQKVAAADNVASCLIEALVWNVPSEGFGHDTLSADLRYVLVHLYNKTKDDEKCREWGEVSELKYLFRPSQPWSREGAHNFILAAWNYIGFQ
jgi:hypothetical protein